MGYTLNLNDRSGAYPGSNAEKGGANEEADIWSHGWIGDIE